MDSSDRVWRERGLLCAVLAGDERAWRTWYEESFDPLYGYTLWRCAGLRDLADEVVQETWLTAVRRIRCFDPERGSFAAWLCGIAANVLRNRLRREKFRTRLARPLGDHAGAGVAPDRRELAEQVARALAELPQRYEAVLRAKYLDQRSVNEIAAAWGETPKAIESLLTRARQAFRAAYQKLEGSHD
jgi:RNA polymerase sigma-70 factor (ECF subfamily)